LSVVPELNSSDVEYNVIDILILKRSFISRFPEESSTVLTPRNCSGMVSCTDMGGFSITRSPRSQSGSQEDAVCIEMKGVCLFRVNA